MELPRNFTTFTPIEDILDSKKGKEILGPVIKKLLDENNAEGQSDESLGEAGAKMFENMIKEMPVLSLASFGMMSVDEVRGLLDSIN